MTFGRTTSTNPSIFAERGVTGRTKARPTFRRSLFTARCGSGLSPTVPILFFAFFFALAGCHREAQTQFPNAPVILISIDTLRADHLSIYGAKVVDTPAIDRLASDGIV